jgi:hypothetical protein
MALFSRAFIRKRVISLATTASVAATSFALAQDPARTLHVRSGIQYVADRQEESAEQTFLSENAIAMHKMMTDMMIKPTGDTQQREITVMQNAVRDGKSSSAQTPAQRHAAVPQSDLSDGSAVHGGMGMSR